MKNDEGKLSLTCPCTDEPHGLLNILHHCSVWMDSSICSLPIWNRLKSNWISCLIMCKLLKLRKGSLKRINCRTWCLTSDSPAQIPTRQWTFLLEWVCEDLRDYSFQKEMSNDLTWCSCVQVSAAARKHLGVVFQSGLQITWFILSGWTVLCRLHEKIALPAVLLFC